MKKLLVSLALGLSALTLGLGASAQTAPAETPAVTAPAEAAPAAPAAAEAAEAAAPAADAPKVDSGDTAWMLTSTLLVILMIIPGLALFYGGLGRSKNMLSVLMQVFVIFSLISILWSVYGYSLAFTGDGKFIGSFEKLFLNGVTTETFGALSTIPEHVFISFQGTFAAITVALIVGAFAERAKFSGVLVFSVLWFTFSYLPMAHIVWGGGLLAQDGALDFAGGTVVHINAGIAGLVGAYVVGKRLGFGREAFTPHSLTLTMVGASLLWWAGSASTPAPPVPPTAARAWPSSTPCWPPRQPRSPGSWARRCTRARPPCWAPPRAPWAAWWPSRRPLASSASGAWVASSACSRPMTPSTCSACMACAASSAPS